MALYYKAVDALGRTHVRRSVRDRRYIFAIVALAKGAPPASWASRAELADKERARLSRIFKHVEMIPAEPITSLQYRRFEQESARVRRLQTLPGPADGAG